MSLITLDEAKLHLRIDHNFDDADIQLKLDTAEEQAINFLERQVFLTEDALNQAVLSNTAGDRPMLINSSFKSAVLLLLGHLYENREETSSANSSNVKYGFERLLIPYRINIGV
jgi:hypothetical protein